jgi:hypothetical protein
MKLTPLQMIVMIVILAGIVYGTYSATMDQLPDITGSVLGNTTSGTNITNNTIGTVYVQDDSQTTNTLIIITTQTKIYKESNDNQQVETDMRDLTQGCRVEIHTIGDATNTIPPQIVAERIVIKKVEQ